jgi:tetratricopeptide (TPR) repeat protein
MLPLIRTLIWAPLFLLTACATVTSNEHDRAPYYEASYDDKNRAPAALVPAPLENINGEENLGPLYMRTQADYYFAVGEAYSLEGNATKAIEAFNSTLIYDQKSPLVNIRLAGEYLKQGMISESLNQAELAVLKDSKNTDALLLLGGLYSSMKLYPKAMAQYENVLKINPSDMEAPLYMGALYSEQKQPEKAISYFNSLIRNSEYTTPYLAHYYIGRVRMEQPGQKFEKAAEESFKKALSLKPDFVEAVLSLSALYSKQKQDTKAIALYRSFQKQNVPSPKVAEILAQFFIEKESYDLAMEQLEILDHSSEDSLNIKMKIALILIEQKKLTKAITKLEEILTIAPESDKARFYLAAVYEESNQKDLAVREFKKIPAGSTFFGDSIAHATFLLKGMGKIEEAVEVVSKGLKARTDQPQIYSIYASLLDEKADYKGAANLLEQGLGKFPNNTQLRFYYGAINDRLGNKDVVINQMKKVLELNPNHVQGLNYLAFTFAELNTNLPDAEKLARRAMKLEPEDGYILDTLGWILFKQSKMNESIKLLEAAYKYQGSVSVIAEHLGDAYYKHSMVNKAKKMYNRAVLLETDKRKIAEIRSKISVIENQEINPTRLPAAIRPQITESSR